MAKQLLDGEYYYKPPAKKTVAKKAVYYPAPAAKKPNVTRPPDDESTKRNATITYTPKTPAKRTINPPKMVAVDQYAANRGYYTVPSQAAPMQPRQTAVAPNTTPFQSLANKAAEFVNDRIDHAKYYYDEIRPRPKVPEKPYYPQNLEIMQAGMVPNLPPIKEPGWLQAYGDFQYGSQKDLWSRISNPPTKSGNITRPVGTQSEYYNKLYSPEYVWDVPGYPEQAVPEWAKQPPAWKSVTSWINEKILNGKQEPPPLTDWRYYKQGFPIASQMPDSIVPGTPAFDAWRKAYPMAQLPDPAGLANQPKPGWQDSRYINPITFPRINSPDYNYHNNPSNQVATPWITTQQHNVTRMPGTAATNAVQAKAPYQLPQWHPYQYRGEFDPYEQGGSPYKITDPFNFPQMTMAELMASGADPWAHDPYDPAGTPYRMEGDGSGLYSGDNAGGGGGGGYGDWGGWGGGGGGGYFSMPSSPSYRGYGGGGGYASMPGSPNYRGYGNSGTRMPGSPNYTGRNSANFNMNPNVNGYNGSIGSGGYGNSGTAPSYTGRGAGRGSTYAGSDPYNTAQWRMPMLVWNI